ncbi:hypothetical protein P43SY_006965 [Pythium insidiosum]|uniref:CCDC81 HU domain-containing protein n=1 Tax=Pythium insidiosum TaxID=114742 RepID=A0AAD5Q9A8_PYTIN|nr:hypothetical protein P43SY_006965 [Pythium insidiosum]
MLSDCIEQLERSPYDYQKLLATSLRAVWAAVGRLCERQLRARKGLQISSLGRFGIIRDLQHVAPVFLLADRFKQSYGACWKRPPPVVLGPTAELSMAVVGQEAGVPRDHAANAFDALWGFIGSRLQRGDASGRLPLGEVGAFHFSGSSLAFSFDAAFVRSIGASAASAPTLSNSLSRLRLGSDQETAPARRSASVPMLAPIDRPTVTTLSLPIDADAEASKQEQATKVSDKQKKKKKHKRTKHERRREATGPREPHDQTVKQRDEDSPPLSQILPPFLRPQRAREVQLSRAVPDEARREIMADAFTRAEREIAQDDARRQRKDDEIALRTKAAQFRYLQQQAERELNRRDLYAFLNGQMEEKRAAKRAEVAANACLSDYDAVRTLPRDPIVTAATKRAAKQRLYQRLQDQVAVKDALQRDQRAIEQAESAFVHAKLREFAAQQASQALEQERIDRAVLVDGWTRQVALRAARERHEG